MDLKHLREFYALAETGSFARAAERLTMSQSAISKHIAALEAELGAQLFNRRQRGVTLSEFGELLYPYAKEILIEQERYSETFTKIKDAQHQAINIGAVGVLKLYGLMEPVKRFKLEHPEIEVNIHNSEYDLKDKLLKGQVDIAFVREPAKLFFEDEQIGTVSLVADPIVAVLPAAHPLAGKGPVNLLQLKDEPFYFLDRQLPLSRLCVNTCNSAGFSPKIAGSGFSGADIVEFISRGSGVTMLAKRPFETYFGGYDKVAAVEIKQYMRTYITLIYLRDHENHIVNDLFLKYFRALLQPKLL